MVSVSVATPHVQRARGGGRVGRGRPRGGGQARCYSFRGRTKMIVFDAVITDILVYVSTHVGDSIMVDNACRSCLITIRGYETRVDLLLLNMVDFDVILGLIKDAILRPSSGEEETKSPVPKPGEDKKRKTASQSEDPKPKPRRVRRKVIALTMDSIQKLRNEEEKEEENASALTVRPRKAVEVTKTSELTTTAKMKPRVEEASKKKSGDDPELLEAFAKFRADLSQCETELQRVSEERNALKLLCGQKDETIKDLQVDLAKAHEEEVEFDKQVSILLVKYGLGPTVEANTSLSQLQQKVERIELLREEVNQVKADCDRWKENMDCLAAEKETTLAKLSSTEVQLRGVKEKSLAQAKRIEELETGLTKAKVEIKKTKVMADKSIAMYRADVEAVQMQLREASDQEKWIIDSAKCQSQRETLEEIHSRGFDLSEEIARAKVLEAEARQLASFDNKDDDEEGN
ncbi:uncharacterized protein [Nicotiana tomentosiformis]|uniref:uncharacterized protein n=1 Tax=Nicotiana tomentosiformis TaxID=4098 RepID=UPI00388CC222